MLGTSNAQSRARSPRAIVRINGVPVNGWIEWTVTNNTYYEADTFTVSFAASRLPVAFDADWFSQQTEIFLEILAGFPANPSAPTTSELTSLLYGRIDNIDYEPSGFVMTVSGRDLIGAFIDRKLIASYSNQTASKIVKAIAKARGIAANVTETEEIVGSPFGTPLGTYNLRSTAHLTTNNSEWDLISSLARDCGFVVYMQEQTLYFGPDPTPTTAPYLITWTPATGGPPSSNTTALSLSRALTVAKGISVTAMSGSMLGPSVIRSYPRSAGTIKPGDATTYEGFSMEFEAQNLTPELEQAANS